MHYYTLPQLKNPIPIKCWKCSIITQHNRLNWIDVYDDHREIPCIGNTCVMCGAKSYDHYEIIEKRYHVSRIYPLEIPQEIPPPNEDLPRVCRDIYKEAAFVTQHSPRAAAALLRLLIQQLMPVLGEKGTNIHADINSLIDKGVSHDIAQALDSCRIIGNEAVHPGRINFEEQETQEMIIALFNLINYIADIQLTQPRKAAELHAKLPPNKRNAKLSKGDNTATNPQTPS